MTARAHRRRAYLLAAEAVFNGAEGVYMALETVGLYCERTPELDLVTERDSFLGLTELPADERAMLLILAATIACPYWERRYGA